MKILITIFASMLAVTAHASPKETISHHSMRLVNDSNIMLVDLNSCFDARMILIKETYKSKDRYPNLKFPKFLGNTYKDLPLFNGMPSNHPLTYKLLYILYNKETKKYLNFRCDPFGGTKKDPIMLEIFVESISIERMQKFIDDEHQKWLEKENKNSQKVSEILEL